MVETTQRPAPTQAAPPLETWAVVELMGHVRNAGRLTEESHFGVALGRLDVPMSDGSFTTIFFGGTSVYRITPCSEELARRIASQSCSEPISRWEAKHLLLPLAPDEEADIQPPHRRAGCDESEEELDLDDEDDDSTAERFQPF